MCMARLNLIKTQYLLAIDMLQYDLYRGIDPIY